MMDTAPGQRWTAFGRWVEAQRTAEGERRGDKLTQEECARAAGMTQKQWSRIETGVSGTRYDTIPRIAQAVNAPAEDAFLAAGYMPPQTDKDQARKDIAERLRLRREYIRMTQEEVADALGIPRATYTQYETARVNLPSERVAPLCRILGVSSDWLFGLSDSEPPRGSGVEPGLLDEIKRIVGDAIRATVAKTPETVGGGTQILPDSSIGRAADSGSAVLNVGPLPGGIALAGAY